MDLIYLHGPPASGKLTIARELEARAGCGVFHNHLAIDLARPFFAFDTAPFWKLVTKVRLTALDAAADLGAGTIAYTSCYDHPADLPQFEAIERIVQRGGGSVRPVYLQCSRAELERRVTNQSRVDRGKLRSVDGLRAQLEKWNCIAVPRDGCLTVLTEGRTPSESADVIIDELRLARRSS